MIRDERKGPCAGVLFLNMFDGEFHLFDKDRKIGQSVEVELGE